MKEKVCYGIMLAFIGCVLLCGIGDAQAASASITRVVFTTESRAVSPGTISEIITIQTQNASGEEEKLDSTADVVFTSSSGTGEFLGSTGNSVTKTMNAGSANKTFYYRDSSVGEFTITVQVTVRATGATWTSTQQIYVGVDKPMSHADIDTDDTTTVSTESLSVSKRGSSSKSKTTKQQTLKVSAGKARTVVVNTPVYFDPQSNIQSNTVEYTWSFGDGDSSARKQPSHVYYFPGEYHVVLRARYKNQEVVSRTKLNVVVNSLEVNAVVSGERGYIEIENSGKNEINMNGWEIRSAGREYVIATDTIISPSGSIRIPNKVLHFDPGSNEVLLLFPTEDLAYTYRATNLKYDLQQDEVVAQSEQQMAQIEFVEQEILVLEMSATTTNYATTVRAVAATPKGRGWWSFVTSLFSVE